MGDQYWATLGFWLTEKRWEKIEFGSFMSLCSEAGIRVCELDLKHGLVALERQGPFDCIMHRVSDLLCQHKEGNYAAAAQLALFKRYICSQPEVQVLDPLSAVRKLCHRLKMYTLIRKQLAFEDVQVPPFVLIKQHDSYSERVSKVRRALLSYPLVAKPALGHKHKMGLVFNERGLQKLHLDTALELPVVLQTFIPHHGVLFKLFIIGGKHQIVVRPSLRNLKPDTNRDNVFFTTADVSKANSHSGLNPDRPADLQRVWPDERKVQGIVRRLAHTTKLTLLGVDLILEQSTGRHYIIDMNYFPGYEGMNNVAQTLFDHVLPCLTEAKRKQRKMPSIQASTASERTDSQ